MRRYCDARWNEDEDAARAELLTLIDEAQLLSDNPLTGMSCANRARIAGERDSLGRLS
jgi:hypothetical protein